MTSSSKVGTHVTYLAPSKFNNCPLLMKADISTLFLAQPSSESSTSLACTSYIPVSSRITSRDTARPLVPKSHFVMPDYPRAGDLDERNSASPSSQSSTEVSRRLPRDGSHISSTASTSTSSTGKTLSIDEERAVFYLHHILLIVAIHHLVLLHHLRSNSQCASSLTQVLFTC